MNGTTIEGLTALGAATLRHFRHPEDWNVGESVNESYRGMMILAVDHLRSDSGTIAVKQSHQSIIWAIRAWAASVGIKPYQLRLTIVAGCVLVSIPRHSWDYVLSRLEALA